MEIETIQDELNAHIDNQEAEINRLTERIKYLEGRTFLERFRDRLKGQS